MTNPQFEKSEYYIVPAGCKYYSQQTKQWLSEGDKMPTLRDGDIFMEPILEAYPQEANYKYRYNDFCSIKAPYVGWNVECVTNLINIRYGKIRSHVRGKPVNAMVSTFANCHYMIQAPAIPETVTIMDGTFAFCESLLAPPEIPENVVSMQRCFNGCRKIEKAPVLPQKVHNITSMFRECTNLKFPPVLPSSIKIASQAFENCYNLKYPPSLPIKLERMNRMFCNCHKMEFPPILPESLIDMSDAFAHCQAMSHIPSIPSNVKKMKFAFYGCMNVSGTCEINLKHNISEEDCRKWLKGVTAPILLVGTSPYLRNLAEYSEGLDVSIEEATIT